MEWGYNFGCRLRPPFARVFEVVRDTYSWPIVAHVFRQYPFLAEWADFPRQSPSSPYPFVPSGNDVSVDGIFVRCTGAWRRIFEELECMEDLLTLVADEVYWFTFDNDYDSDEADKARIRAKIQAGLEELQRQQREAEPLHREASLEAVHVRFSGSEWSEGALGRAISTSDGSAEHLGGLFVAACEHLDPREWEDETVPMLEPFHRPRHTHDPDSPPPSLADRDTALELRRAHLCLEKGDGAPLASRWEASTPAAREMALMLATITGLVTELPAELLRSALRDDAWHVRWAAVRAIGELGTTSHEFTADLEDVLQRSEGTLYEAAARALGEIAPERLTSDQIDGLPKRAALQTRWLDAREYPPARSVLAALTSWMERLPGR